ncbi:PPOX class probable F420-dependent enzyme [Nocardia transvalensis]|uniref:PPOX class probable F420-dependent enzyme n=1 Tax=Nocardia transvalensis TaxID=37333 RepID=A0A7W9P9Q6_9NOCA|nr:TIGR03618 family F420-dependent PPOX class oxidoreductase [Nocardia transvalensis]MBB5911714.1 PPOX class probable F420-dependent enzyme [Nocardia transvalensis]
MPDLKTFAELAAQDHGLCVVVTLRPDGTPQATVVNAGVLPHPLTGADVVGFVARGGTAKLAYLRANPTIAITVRSGWQWVTVESSAQLIGPDDPHPEVDGERLRVMLRDVFTAAGGTHDDWDTYDRVMHAERRAVVLVTPTRVYSNPS